MRHLSRQDPNTVNALLDAVADAKESSQVDLEAFDYSSLRVRPESFWVVQLAHMGFADRTGRAASDPFPGSQPTFQIVICRPSVSRGGVCLFDASDLSMQRR